MAKKITAPKTKFLKDTVIYMPAYNCEDTIVSVIREIPADVASKCDILVVNNCSSDNTLGKISEALKNKKIPAHVQVATPETNKGYAGSQKFAYNLVLANSKVKWVLMLHGDGQYPAELVPAFLAERKPGIGVVYGFRSKSAYPQEETPFLSWFMIKSLSILESFITGVRRKEWHSGYVMYSTDFLRKVKFSEVTDTPHIDGNLLFLSGVLPTTVKAIPIFKKYKELTAFEGAARRKYVVNVLKLMWGFRNQRKRLAQS